MGIRMGPREEPLFGGAGSLYGKGHWGVVGQINDDDRLKHNTAVVHKRRKVEVDNVLRNGLFDALHRQSGTHYGKLFSRVTLDSSL